MLHDRRLHQRRRRLLTLNKGGGWWIPGSQLDLDFANDRSYNRLTGYNATPNGLLTYTSPSPKMVYGDDGVLGYAPHNFITYSEQLDNAAWTKSGVTVSANAIAASDGSSTSDRLVEDSGTSVHAVLSASHVFIGMPYRTSVEVKAAGRNFAIVTMRATEHGVSINLTTGATSVAVGSPTEISATDKGNGWWKLEFTATPSAGSAAVNVYASVDGVWANRSYLGDGASGIYVWGAQLNRGSTALDYLATTSAAKYSLPLDHDPLTGEALGVLIEEQRTNLLLQSQTFATTWNVQRCTVTSDAALGGDGTQTADAFVEDSASGSHQLYQVVAKAASSIKYTISVEIEPDNRTWCRILASTAGEANFASTFYSLTGDGALGSSSVGGSGFTNHSASITLLPNGRYKLTLTFTSDTATVVTIGIKSADANGSLAHVGNGLTAFYLWGAQLEAGAFATSYIQTGSAQVTRAADAVSILASAFNWDNSAGTFLVGASVKAISSGASGYFAACAGSGGNNNTHNLYRTSSAEELQIRSGSSTVAAINPSGATGSVKMAYAYSVDDYAISKNGGSVGSDTSGALPIGVDRIQLGTVAGGNYANGTIKRLTYWNSRKDNATLQVLST